MREGGIYKITFPNGKSYIGQSCDLKRRMREYKNGQKTCKQQVALYNAFKMYGYDSCTITFLYKDGGELNYDILNQKEIDLIKEHNTLTPNGYNIEKGGRGHSSRHINGLCKFIEENWPYPYEPITNEDETIEYENCLEGARHEKVKYDDLYFLEYPDKDFIGKYKNEKKLKTCFGDCIGERETIYEHKHHIYHPVQISEEELIAQYIDDIEAIKQEQRELKQELEEIAKSIDEIETKMIEKMLKEQAIPRNSVNDPSEYDM